MGEKDIAEKILLAYNDVFSDIVNVLLFGGQEIIRENDLEDQITDGMNERDMVDDRIFLEQLISKLSRTERELIYMRYYLDCTQTAVAKELHMTQVQVSRLEKKLLQRMREEAGQQKIK